MSGIYGPITEHPEFDITDERRFTVTIKPHRFESNNAPYLLPHQQKCGLCGWRREHRVHQT